MTGAYDDLRAAEVPVRRACTLIGRARATHYRHQKPPVHGPARPRRAPDNGQALTDTECAQVLALINTPKYTDLAICQIWARELDEGNYWCSTSSMYRIANAAGQTRERRRQATHPAKVKPELLADGPSQVWTWDITKLRGPVKWSVYYLYVLLDLYSRFAVGWLIAERESAQLAQSLIAEACRRQGIARLPAAAMQQLTVHSDRGGPMTAKSLALLMADLGVNVSHSRPRTSNDNPFSEAQFKTAKYHPSYPDFFDSVVDARVWGRDFFPWYNFEHRHIGLGLMTPAAVHYGWAPELRERRQHVLGLAYQAHPERFVRGHPTPPELPVAVWINPLIDGVARPGLMPVLAPPLDVLERH